MIALCVLLFIIGYVVTGWIITYNDTARKTVEAQRPKAGRHE